MMRDYVNRIFLYDFAEQRFMRREDGDDAAWNTAVILMFTRIGIPGFFFICTVWILANPYLPMAVRLGQMSRGIILALVCVYVVIVYVLLHRTFGPLLRETIQSDLAYTPSNRLLSRVTLMFAAASALLAWGVIRVFG